MDRSLFMFVVHDEYMFLKLSAQLVQMISERALKGQRDKLHFCTSLAPPNVNPTVSLARLL